MKAIGACILALALLASLATLVTPLQGAQVEEVYEPYKKMGAVKRANVRAGPSTNHKKIHLLEVGKPVFVASKQGNWYKLWPRLENRYVYAPLLTDVRPTVQTIVYRGGEYIGPTRNGRPHGRGVLSWPDGHRYEGEFANGWRTGRGVYTWPDGERYEGRFVDNKRTGRGVYTWADGRRYEGDIVDGWLQGRGVMRWASGNRYEGYFVKDKRTGRGVFTWPDGRRYEGDFVEGKRSGRGVFTWPNGDRYEGDFVDDWRTGRGVYTWSDGRRYEGDFVKNRLQGNGVTVNADGSRHEGEYKNDQYHGAGIYTVPDGRSVAAIFVDGILMPDSVTILNADGTFTSITQQSGANWGAYIEVGDYGEGEQGYGLAWNYPNPQAALRAAYRECLKGNSYDECGGNDLARSYGFQYWVFSTSRMPAGVRRFPNRHEDDGLSKSYYRFDVEGSVFAVFYVQQRCIAVYGAGPEGSFSAWDLDREFGNSEVEVRRKIYHDHPIKAVACNKH